MNKNSENEKYAYLDQLSTEDLEEFLSTEIDSPTDGDDSVIFHILEVIVQREKAHPTGRLPDTDKAWAEFKQFYDGSKTEVPELYSKGLEGNKNTRLPTFFTSTGDPIPNDSVPVEPISGGPRIEAPKMKPARCPSSTLKAVGVAAAVIVGFFGMMIGAQAAGFDVFGAIGRWTDETFQFIVSEDLKNGLASSPESAAYHNLLQNALEDRGITEDLAPTWYPAGYEGSEPEVFSDGFSESVYVAYLNKENDFFNINITCYQSAYEVEEFTVEKDASFVEQYTSGTKTFYILSNMDTVTAIWSDGYIVERIFGNLSIEEVKTMIDSIGVD